MLCVCGRLPLCLLRLLGTSLPVYVYVCVSVYMKAAGGIATAKGAGSAGRVRSTNVSVMYAGGLCECEGLLGSYDTVANRRDVFAIAD